jgi:plastocyanin
VRAAITALALAVVAAGCGGGGGGGRPATTPDAASVAIELYAFTPGSVTVAAGQPVTWTERDDDLEGNGAHSVVADDKSFASELVRKGMTFSFTPSKAGTIRYHCGVHNYMTGTITVR